MELDIVRVKWLDSCVYGGWNLIVHYQEKGPGPSETVGYLVKKTRKQLNLVQSIGRDCASDGIVIPRGCVLSIEVLGKRNYPLEDYEL